MSLSSHLAPTSRTHDLGDEGPHPVDRHVGLRIRMRRKEMGVTQEALADALGLTFQQIQKYERAANRVSASKLWEIAQALSAPVAYFYEGLGEASRDTGGTGDARTQEFLLTPEGLELAGAFPRIGRGRLRRKVLELVRVLADPDTSTQGGEDVTLSS